MRRLAPAVLLAVVVTVSAACGDDGGSAAPDAPPSTESSSGGAGMGPPMTGAPAGPGGGPPTTLLPASPLGPWTLDAITAGGFPQATTPLAPLVDVRTGEGEGYQRLVFEFAGDTPPSYEVAYVEGPVVNDPTGEAVDTGGAATLVVRMVPASTVDDGFAETYVGNRVVEVGGNGPMRRVSLIGDFESLMSWAVGLDARVPFVAATLDDPTRLVVDVLAAS